MEINLIYQNQIDEQCTKRLTMNIEICRLIHMPGEYEIAEAIGLYERDNDQEKLKIPGPIKHDAVVYVGFKVHFYCPITLSNNFASADFNSRTPQKPRHPLRVHATGQLHTAASVLLETGRLDGLLIHMWRWLSTSNADLLSGEQGRCGRRQLLVQC